MTDFLPFVSIIVPVKNNVKIIHDCLLSLLNLEYDKGMLEIIVVDGFSSDGTYEVASKLPVKIFPA